MKEKTAKDNAGVITARKRTGVVGIVILAIAFVITVVLAAVMIINQNNRMSRDNTNTMNSQLTRSVQNRLKKLEDITTRVFQMRDYVKYNAADESRTNEYEALKKEKEISEFLVYMSTADNYNDFCFLYSNNHVVGRISKTTNEMLGSDAYNSADTYLKGRNSLWLTGVNNDFSRLYYLHRVSDSAVFIGSMFTESISDVFPEAPAKHLSFVLTDNNGNVIFSVNNTDTAQEALKTLKSEWSDSEPVTVDCLRYAASSSRCAENWHVISVSDFSGRNARYLRILVYCSVILVAALAAVLFTSVVYASSKMPDNIIYREQYKAKSVDRLTGLMMNEALENAIVDRIDRCINGTTMVLLLVKIKNYELISENYGEKAVEEALVKVADALKEHYAEKNTVGRTGENEFAVLADFTDFNLFKAYEKIRDNAKQLEAALDKLELDNERGMITCAVGASVYPDDNDDYDVLCENARAALEESAKARICKCVFYKDMKDKEAEKK